MRWSADAGKLLHMMFNEVRLGDDVVDDSRGWSLDDHCCDGILVDVSKMAMRSLKRNLWW